MVRIELPHPLYWTLLGGGLELAESAQEAAMHEVWEETHLSVRITDTLLRQYQRLGHHPEFVLDDQQLCEVAWVPLEENKDKRAGATILKYKSMKRPTLF